MKITKDDVLKLLVQINTKNSVKIKGQIGTIEFIPSDCGKYVYISNFGQWACRNTITGLTEQLKGVFKLKQIEYIN